MVLVAVSRRLRGEVASTHVEYSREEGSGDLRSSHNEREKLHKPLAATGGVVLVVGEISEGDPSITFDCFECSVFQFSNKVVEVEGAVEAVRQVQLFKISREVLANGDKSVEDVVQFFEVGNRDLKASQVVGAGYFGASFNLGDQPVEDLL